MALITADRIKETTSVLGMGIISLGGAATGYRAFSSVCANGDVVPYCIANPVNGEWEVGIGSYDSTSDRLSRDTILASSNAGAAVFFGVGTKDVFLTLPASRVSTAIHRGTVTLDFGAWPGSNEASVAITGQTDCTASSVFMADILAVATSNHTAADAAYADALISLSFSAPTAGVGATLYARSLERLEGQFAASYFWI